VTTLLRTRREQRQMSADDLARHLAVHRNSVLRWERRERLPGPDHVRALARTLDLDTSEVAGFFDAARVPAAPATGVRGHGLRSVRQAARVPVSRIAGDLGVRAATVYNWEAGRARIPDEHLPRLASLVGTSESRLRQALRAALAIEQTTPVSPLRRLRRRSGLSQETVAGRIGVSRHRVGTWERGTRPPLWAVRALAAVYGVPVSLLARVAGVPAPPLLDRQQWDRGDLPRVLRTLRAWSGLTQREVAARCGVHPTSVRAWEAGRTVPGARSRGRLERLYGLAAGDLRAAYPDED
jgi:transcriptional regulator with XRE-family HTH domain